MNSSTQALKESGVRSQELQELQNMRARSLSENPGQASPGKISAGIQIL